MSRPRAAPALVAALVAQAPARLVKRLEAAPRAADAWRWSARDDGSFTVTTDGGEVVTLAAGVVEEPASVRCSCLLAPRCFHLLATVSALELADAPGPAAEAAEAAEAAPPDGDARLDPDQRRAAEATWRAAAALLDAGAAGAGPIVQAELLRGVHACRASRLPRLAGAALRVVRDVQALRADRSEFDLAGLGRDLAELLETAWRLGGAPDGPVAPAWLGEARQRYAPVGGLRLHGLFTEAVVSGTGWAGVVTWLADAAGRLWSVHAVEPGENERAAASYEAPAAIGDATLAHRELGRDGLFLQDATASREGRLGAGRGVRAVRAGATAWDQPPVDALWAAPLAGQLQRGRAPTSSSSSSAAGLVFFRGEVVGRVGDDLALAADGHLLRCEPPTEHEALGARDLLRLLACGPGLRLRGVGRVRGAGRLALLAVGPDGPAAETPALRLPALLAGRVNVGLDRLGRAALEGGLTVPRALEAPPAPPDPLETLRRRLLRLALGGRSVAAPGALGAVEEEARLLERRLLPTAARLHRALATTALGAARTATGQRGRTDPPALARAWLACAVYERAARDP